ncbi:MAG TPA: hypothetical protein VFK94_00670 [Patescibacteria group bacterium]|nr:hypothetical protein [Patescibacteria group bacterium]
MKILIGDYVVFKVQKKRLEAPQIRSFKFNPNNLFFLARTSSDPLGVKTRKLEGVYQKRRGCQDTFRH